MALERMFAFKNRRFEEYNERLWIKSWPRIARLTPFSDLKQQKQLGVQQPVIHQEP